MHPSPNPVDHGSAAPSPAETSRLIVERTPRYVRALLDDVDQTRARAILDQVEHAYEAPEWLKKGTSCSVIRIVVEGRPLVLKRFNLKTRVRRLKALVRPTRAARCFRLGHALRAAGVRTPVPLGYQVERRGLLRGRSYLVTEFVEGPNGRESMGRPGDDWRTAAAELADQLNRMWLAGFCHGDLKSKNILFHDAGASLVDLDSMKRLRGTWLAIDVAKDQERLLRNWDEGTELRSFLAERLVEPAACARARPFRSYLEPLVARIRCRGEGRVGSSSAC